MSQGILAMCGFWSPAIVHDGKICTWRKQQGWRYFLGLDERYRLERFFSINRTTFWRCGRISERFL